MKIVAKRVTVYPVDISSRFIVHYTKSLDPVVLQGGFARISYGDGEETIYPAHFFKYIDIEPEVDEISNDSNNCISGDSSQSDGSD